MPAAIKTLFSRDLLDSLGIAVAEYGADLRAVSWNNTFLRFFPEHADTIHVGEAYADNLRRFYRTRLQGADLAELERLVAEGVQRHVNQAAPFEFEHNGRRLQVASERIPGGGRIRVWKEVTGFRRLTTENTTPALDSLELIAEGACILDAKGRIVVANSRFRDLYDVSDDCNIVGQSLDDIVERAWGSARHLAAMRATIRNALRYDNAPFEIELPHDRWRRVVTRHADHNHSYLVHSDMTGSHRTERELRNLAFVDPLTSLLNRRALTEYLAAQSDPIGFVAIDADHFKAVNDQHGHKAGDDCLVRIATFLQSYAGMAGGIAARLGGEEFAVVITPANVQRMILIGEQIRAAIAGSGHPQVTVSVGVAVGHAAGVQQAADEALYRAKRLGRNRVELAGSLAA